MIKVTYLTGGAMSGFVVDECQYDADSHSIEEGFVWLIKSDTDVACFPADKIIKIEYVH